MPTNRLLTKVEVDHWMQTGEMPADCTPPAGLMAQAQEASVQPSSIAQAAEHQRALNSANSAQIEAFSSKGQEMLQTHYAYVAGTRCPLMPATAHCWHEQLELWSDLFPPEMVCCWCNARNGDVAATPHRHGPHVPKA